jgi:hypothetical protein
MDIIIPEDGSHWYTRDGEPRHEVPCKSRDGMRAVSLRWDRHLKLFPSVTNILNVKSKPGLEVYKINQAIMSALTLPKIDGEELDDYAKRVVVDMNVHRQTAAAFGNKIHGATEDFHISLKNYGFHNPFINAGEEIEPYVVDYKRWLSEYVDQVFGAEVVMVHPYMGYAGTVDLRARRRSDGRLVIIDTKTQGVRNGKPKFYDTWLLQLRAYGQIDIQEKPVYVSAVINSTEPSPVIIHEWPEKDYRSAWRAFQACHYLWCWDNNYWPTKYWSQKI